MTHPGISALIVDDHPLFRSAVRDILEETGHVSHIDEAANGVECLAKLERQKYSIILLDVNMPGMDGIKCLKEIRKRWKKQKVAILTQYSQPVFFRKLSQLGANGYILKDEDPELIIDAIESILFRNTSILSSRLEKAMKENALRPRELEVLDLMCQGLNSEAIAKALCISINTVNNHRAALSRKIKSNNLATQVCWAINNGYYSLDH